MICPFCQQSMSILGYAATQDCRVCLNCPRMMTTQTTYTHPSWKFRCSSNIQSNDYETCHIAFPDLQAAFYSFRNASKTNYETHIVKYDDHNLEVIYQFPEWLDIFSIPIDDLKRRLQMMMVFS
jgi:hypothetical protein